MQGVLRTSERHGLIRVLRVYVLFDREERLFELTPAGTLRPLDVANAGSRRALLHAASDKTADESWNAGADRVRDDQPSATDRDLVEDEREALGRRRKLGAGRVRATKPAGVAEGDFEGGGENSWLRWPVYGLAAFVLATILFPLALLIAGELEARALSYDAFLSREMDLTRLTQVVTYRLDYRRDVLEYWSDPRDAWDAKAGDCEEYALVVAAYLSRHGIEHQVLGLTLRETLEGHAVVLVRTPAGYALIDPPGTAVRRGVAFFPAGEEPAEFLRRYSHLPVSVYSSTAEGPRPELVGLIDALN